MRLRKAGRLYSIADAAEVIGLTPSAVLWALQCNGEAWAQPAAGWHERYTWQRVPGTGGHPYVMLVERIRLDYPDGLVSVWDAALRELAQAGRLTVNDPLVVIDGQCSTAMPGGEPLLLTADMLVMPEPDVQDMAYLFRRPRANAVLSTKQLVQRHGHRWPTLRSDLKHWQRDPDLVAARAGSGRWTEERLVEWAIKRRKMTGPEWPGFKIFGTR